MSMVRSFVVCLLLLAYGTVSASWQPFECEVTAQVGCFEDVGEHADKRKRVLENQVEDAKSLADCAHHCAEHGFGNESFKGVEYGSQCYCGKQLQGHPIKKPNSDCSMSCEDGNETCGGKYRLQVFNASCGAGPIPPQPPGPSPSPPPPGRASVCDLFARGNTPCVAAYSSTRALYGSFSGALYEVTRLRDSATASINVLAPGGVANAPEQEHFCATSSCVISRLFDQSGNDNHLSIFPKDKGVNASAHRTTLNGHPVYGMYFDPGMGYRNDNTNAVPLGEAPETMYAVFAGDHFDDHCCFDFGNAETNDKDDGPGTMEAIYFGNKTAYWKHQPDPKVAAMGGFIMADLEKGMYGGNDTMLNPLNTPIVADFVTAMLKGRSGNMVLKGGNASHTPGLRTLYDGCRPQHCVPGKWGKGCYEPMRKQGAIILGTGGDNSRHGMGTFYEGCIVAGFTSDATDEAVHANIVTSGYGK